MERRQAAMEDKLEKISETQHLHGRHLYLSRLQSKQNNKYMKSIHQHLMGTKRGRLGIFTRLRTLEIRQKAIIGVSSVVSSALIIGLIKALF